jgi:hypothetical protein
LDDEKIPLAKLKPNHTSMVRAKRRMARKLNRPAISDIWLSRPRSSLFHRFSFHFNSVWERSDLPGVAAYLSVFTCMMLIKSIDNHSMPSIQVCNIYGADCLTAKATADLAQPAQMLAIFIDSRFFSFQSGFR